LKTAQCGPFLGYHRPLAHSRASVNADLHAFPHVSYSSTLNREEADSFRILLRAYQSM